MSTLLSSKDGVKARKDGHCCFCHQPIKKGEVHDVRSGVSSDGFWKMRMHPECHAKEQATPYREREDWYYDMTDPVFDRPTTPPTPQNTEGRKL